MSLEQEQRCIHGLNVTSCYDCQTSRVIPKIPEKISPLGKDLSPEGFDTNITSLHLSSYPSLEIIKEILELYPNLASLRVPPFEYKRLMIRAQTVNLLKRNAISIVSGRTVTRIESNLDERNNPQWREERRFLLNLDANGKKVLEKGLELFEEAAMAYRYFCLGDPAPARISYQDLGAEYNLSFGVCRYRILSFLGLLGYPSEGKVIKSGIRKLKSEFKKALVAEREAKAKTKFEVFQPLPDRLQPRHWGQFLELTRIIHQSPDQFQALPQRTQQVLELYFGLDSGEHHTLAMIAEVLDLDVTRCMIGKIKDEALIDLGIKKKKKPSIEPRSLEHCRHGLVKRWCGECNPSEEIDKSEEIDEEEIGEE